MKHRAIRNRVLQNRQGVLFGLFLLFALLLVPVMAVAQQNATDAAPALPQPQPGADDHPETTMQDQQMQDPQAQQDVQEPWEPARPDFIAALDEEQFVIEEMIGSDVINRYGERIGTIRDFIVGDQAQIEGVILGVGGLLGLGERRVALNWDAIQVHRDPEDREQFELMVDVDQETLEEAPRFTRRGE